MKLIVIPAYATIYVNYFILLAKLMLLVEDSNQNSERQSSKIREIHRCQDFITGPKKTPDVSPWDELDSDMSSSFRAENPNREIGEDVM